MWQLRMHCNLRPPEPRQSFPALIMTPCQVWRRWTYPLPYYSMNMNYSVFDAGTFCQAVTLTFDLLTLKVCGTSSVMWLKSVRNLSEIGQSLAELLIILQIFAHVMSRCDLGRWPLDLEFLHHVMRLNSTKFEQNRLIHNWVIDNLAHFHVQFYGMGQNWQSFLRRAWTQLQQTWPGHRAIITALHFCFRIRTSCCIFKCGRLKFEWFKWRQI